MIRLITHIIFWIVSVFILHSIFTKDYDNGRLDYYYTIIFHIPLFFAFYLGTSASVFFTKQKGLTSLLIIPISTLIIAICYGIHHFSFNTLSDILFPNYYFISTYTWIEILQFCTLYLVLGSLIYLSFNRFELKKNELKLIKYSNEAQLNAMKSQINPHFLFNSLNNIFGLISIDSQKAKPYVLKLSDSLRYMLYETETELVSIEKELEYMKNYIELEKLRFEKESQIIYSIQTDRSNYQITPLLLITIIENCFKHADKEQPSIDISILAENQILTLKTRNRIKEKNTDKQGLGLKNLRQRLSLIYAGNHKFEIETKDEFFNSFLEINLEV